jgi:hypothetical protein
MQSCKREKEREKFRKLVKMFRGRKINSSMSKDDLPKQVPAAAKQGLQYLASAQKGTTQTKNEDAKRGVEATGLTLDIGSKIPYLDDVITPIRDAWQTMTPEVKQHVGAVMSVLAGRVKELTQGQNDALKYVLRHAYGTAKYGRGNQTTDTKISDLIAKVNDVDPNQVTDLNNGVYVDKSDEPKVMFSLNGKTHASGRSTALQMLKGEHAVDSSGRRPSDMYLNDGSSWHTDTGIQGGADQDCRARMVAQLRGNYRRYDYRRDHNLTNGNNITVWIEAEHAIIARMLKDEKIEQIEMRIQYWGANEMNYRSHVGWGAPEKISFKWRGVWIRDYMLAAVTRLRNLGAINYMDAIPTEMNVVENSTWRERGRLRGGMMRGEDDDDKGKQEAEEAMKEEARKKEEERIKAEIEQKRLEEEASRQKQTGQKHVEINVTEEDMLHAGTTRYHYDRGHTQIPTVVHDIKAVRKIGHLEAAIQMLLFAHFRGTELNAVQSSAYLSPVPIQFLHRVNAAGVYTVHNIEVLNIEPYPNVELSEQSIVSKALGTLKVNNFRTAQECITNTYSLPTIAYVGWQEVSNMLTKTSTFDSQWHKAAYVDIVNSMFLSIDALGYAWHPTGVEGAVDAAIDYTGVNLVQLNPAVQYKMAYYLDYEYFSSVGFRADVEYTSICFVPIEETSVVAGEGNSDMYKKVWLDADWWNIFPWNAQYNGANGNGYGAALAYRPSAIENTLNNEVRILLVLVGAKRGEPTNTRYIGGVGNIIHYADPAGIWSGADHLVDFNGRFQDSWMPTCFTWYPHWKSYYRAICNMSSRLYRLCWDNGHIRDTNGIAYNNNNYVAGAAFQLEPLNKLCLNTIGENWQDHPARDIHLPRSSFLACAAVASQGWAPVPGTPLPNHDFVLEGASLLIWGLSYARYAYEIDSSLFDDITMSARFWLRRKAAAGQRRQLKRYIRDEIVRARMFTGFYIQVSRIIEPTLANQGDWPMRAFHLDFDSLFYSDALANASITVTTKKSMTGVGETVALGSIDVKKCFTYNRSKMTKKAVNLLGNNEFWYTYGLNGSISDKSDESFIANINKYTAQSNTFQAGGQRNEILGPDFITREWYDISSVNQAVHVMANGFTIRQPEAIRANPNRVMPLLSAFPVRPGYLYHYSANVGGIVIVVPTFAYLSAYNGTLLVDDQDTELMLPEKDPTAEYDKEHRVIPSLFDPNTGGDEEF